MEVGLRPRTRFQSLSFTLLSMNSVGITSGFGTNKSSTGTVEPDTLEPEPPITTQSTHHVMLRILGNLLMLLWIWLVKGARFICRRKDDRDKNIVGERERPVETEKQWTVIKIT